MAIKVNKDALPEEGEYTSNPETMHIPAGTHPAVLVSYVELGKHYKTFMGKKAVYGKESKKAGQVRPPELLINLVFEFPTCEYTGDFPLCIATSVPMKAGGTMNTLSVSDSLAEGTLSRSFAMKTNFMKYLVAMQDATGKDYQSLADFVGTGFLCTVTNNTGKPDKDGNVRTYANMKPDGIQGLSFRHPVTGVVETIPCPEPIGTYCSVFDWDDPDIEEFNKLPKYMKEFIAKAENFPGSAIEALIKGQPSSEGTEDMSEETVQEPVDPAEPYDDDVPY